MNLNLLQYHKKWIEYDLISEKEIQNQLEQFKNGDDKNAEHYRYRTLIAFIRSQDKFYNLQIDRFIEIVKSDPDQTMAGSAFSELMISGKLHVDQYESAKKEFFKFGKWTKKFIAKIELDN